MKTNAIVRIILFSLAILVLLGILIAGLAFRHYSFNFRSFPGYIRGNSAENGGTVSQSGSVEASLVHNIEIDWAAGSITVQPGDTDKIIFSETEVREENLKMVWKQSGDKLVIQFRKDNFNWNGFNFGSDLSKDLIVTVPRDWNCKELDLDAASAKVKVSELTIEKVDMDTASGICTFENCNVDEIDFDTASGNVYFSGTLNTLNCDSASASCTVVLTNVPKRINMNGVSGDLDITLPENCGFSASVDSVSGRFTSDFPTTVSGGHYTYGDGSCRIGISAVSGNLYIQKCGESDAGSHHSSD